MDRRNSVDIIEPSQEDVTSVLAEIRLVLSRKRVTCRQSPYGITFPGGTARLYAYVERSGNLRLTTVSMNGQKLDEFNISVGRLASDPQVLATLEPLVSFVADSLKIANALQIAKKMADPNRYPDFKRYTSTQRSIHVPVAHGGIWMYRSCKTKTIVLEEHPDKANGRCGCAPQHCIPIETLLYGQRIPDPQDKSKKPREIRVFCDASFFAAINRVRFPDPNAEEPKRQICASTSHRGVPLATQEQ